MAVTSTKQFLEFLQADLRSLSTEAKRKYPPVKEAAESGILKIRTVTAKAPAADVISALAKASGEILQPFLLACDTKNSKMIQISLNGIQRLITHEAISQVSANNIINMLWQLMETEMEELKVLQTVLVLLTTSVLVKNQTLAKAIVICFRLHFFKDSTTSNTASATVRQVVSIVFERVIAEDSSASLKQGSSEPAPAAAQPSSPSGKTTPGGSNKLAPNSLSPHAADAYLLFQDLCQLVNADQPLWLVGMTEMTRTFGLELLENILNTFSEVFFRHLEFSFLLKERVCPLVIKLFSPNLKYRQGQSMPSPASTVDKPFFPISARLLRVLCSLIQKYYSILVTECEIFLALLVKFLEVDKPLWQRGLAMEVLYRICMKPELIRSFCESYDMKPHSTKVFRDIVNGLGAFIQSLFIVSSVDTKVSSQTTGNQNPSQHPSNTGAPSLVANMPIGAGVTPQPAFVYRGTWIPLVPISSSSTSTSKSTVILDMLDKTDAPQCLVQDGYVSSLAFACLLEIVKSVFITTQDKGIRVELCEELILSSWCGILASLTLLLEASTDEAATASILKSMEQYVNMCGELKKNVARDAFVTALCKASLPPHYSLIVLNLDAAATQQQKTATASTKAGLKRSGSKDSGGVSVPTSISSDAHHDPATTLTVTGSSDTGSGSGFGESRNQVVAVGTPLPTVFGTMQGPVMLTAKNLHCMRSILSVAHCHGAVLGTGWHLVLNTLQHLVWILGLKPSAGGSLKAASGSSAAEGPNAVITTAVMADLPVLSAMLSRLFESSQMLDDVALHHLISALVKLSNEAMELAFANREPSLFAVAKLLETGLVNMSRVEILWRPVTGHLLEVCQHPYSRLREWGAEAVTSLIRAALTHTHQPPLAQNQKLQAMILSPLEEMSGISFGDIRQKQLECILQVLHSNGETLSHGWPLVLRVIGAVSEDQGENLVRVAFQSLQLVVTDFLPTMPPEYLEGCIETGSKFGLQKQELNISLTAIGLLWNIADHLYQNRHKVKASLGQDLSDGLWLSLYSKMADLCVDMRPAVRKSAGQTLFSTISAHACLLQHKAWKSVLWQVLFPLMDKVHSHSQSASQDRSDLGAPGNILIHHSRDTAEKQWAETQVLTLAGVARVFSTWKATLSSLDDFPRAWSLLLQHIETGALSNTSEVSLAALKSFQELLHLPATKGQGQGHLEGALEEERILREESESEQQVSSPKVEEDALDDDQSLWSVAWRLWCNIGNSVTAPPGSRDKKLLPPSQPYLTALIQIFPPLFDHIKTRFVSSDLQRLSSTLRGAVAVPVHCESSPFVLPSVAVSIDSDLTLLQNGVLVATAAVEKAISEGSGGSITMYPALFDLLLVFVSYACRAPSYGKLENAAQNEWVAMNYVPFAEKALRMMRDMYVATAKHSCVVEQHVLQNIVKTLQQPLGLKYACPSQSTWKLAISTLLDILQTALPIAREHGGDHSFSGMWPEVAIAFQNFLFSQNPAPPTLSIEEYQMHENLDIRLIRMIREDILPFSANIPQPFLSLIMAMLNRGSIHSAFVTSFTDTDSTRMIREEFAKACFETLLQFSFISPDASATEGSISKMALLSLLKRCDEVLKKYVEDERLCGKCPLPRPRMTEMSFVLQAVSTLMVSLKKAKPGSVDEETWREIIAIYPDLVRCTTCTSSQVCKALKSALEEYADLLVIPYTH